MIRMFTAVGLFSIRAIASSACGSAQSPTAPTSTALLNALELGIQDEYRAEAIHQGVVND